MSAHKKYNSIKFAQWQSFSYMRAICKILSQTYCFEDFCNCRVARDREVERDKRKAGRGEREKKKGKREREIDIYIERETHTQMERRERQREEVRERGIDTERET